MGESALQLLREFLSDGEIANYDSSLCWGCGELKSGACLPTCLLERSRKVLERDQIQLSVDDILRQSETESEIERRSGQ